MPGIDVTVPSVGESITEGILARWLKTDGDAVEAGEPLFELETDKASSAVPSPSSGVLKTSVAEGETVAIGAIVATIDPSATAAQPKPTSAADQKVAPTAPAPASKPSGADNKATKTLSPAVRRIAAEENVDVARVPATGPGGRVTKGDVLAYIESPQPAAKAAPTSPRAPATSTDGREPPQRETRQRMSGLRQRIAQRLVEAQQAAAILTTFNEADMTRVIELRTQYKESFQTQHGVGLGFMSFFVKASIEALKAFPAVNGRIDGNEIVFHNFFDIGVAVSTDRGLMVPVVRDADKLSFAAIEKAIAGFAAKARDGTISVDDLRGGTFTISNGGIFGSLLSTPIINPPQSGILGMHAIQRRPVAVDEQIVIRPMMYLALSYDHRLIDGREAASFLVRVKDCLESPERLMLEV
jgi:2-oxoglutarate dehydrogenase E2 component (dihydrolipoamide succinyltransferase)